MANVSDLSLMDQNIDELVRAADRHAKSKDDWRKSAIISLAVGNGGGLAALAAWCARLSDFDAALTLFLPAMWIYAAGLFFAGALPFAAWWTTHALSDQASADLYRQLANRVTVTDAESHFLQMHFETRASSKSQAQKFVRPSLIVLRTLIAASALAFVAATLLALSSVSDRENFHKWGSAAEEEAAKHLDSSATSTARPSSNSR
jgi:hypothetical protein